MGCAVCEFDYCKKGKNGGRSILGQLAQNFLVNLYPAIVRKAGP